MPNLENLRKQAKLYLRWHRDRHHPVAAQIRAVLPRFKDLSDRQILDGVFKLGDAQELVARQAGYETWQALKQGVQTMTKSAAGTAAPALAAAEPCLFVTDMNRTLDFFTGKLGFEIAFTYGEPAFYAEVKRDKAAINLRHVDRSPFLAGVREREELLGASLTVDSAAAIKQLFLQYQAAGVDFFRPLRREPWGAQDFIARDPDGNLLLFAGPAS
ncbi:MAG TPA: VOC family protein [Reyranella sp.]|nr:VOC family protein [Reyranella sp.]